MHACPPIRSARLACSRRPGQGSSPKLILNAEAMAKVAGMTWRNLKLIIDADDDAADQERGDMGVPWEFDAAAVLDHLISSSSDGAFRARGADGGVIPPCRSRRAGRGNSPSDRPAGVAGSASQMLRGAQGDQRRHRCPGQGPGREAGAGPAGRCRGRRGAPLGHDDDDADRDARVAVEDGPAGQWPPELRGQVEEELRNVLLTVAASSRPGSEAWRGSRG
jgi:hypothetical protein